MSEWLVLSIAISAVCAVVLSIIVLRQRRVGEDDDPSETPDVIDYMTMMIGVVYAIVLGLAIAGVWEARDAAQAEVRAEAQALHEVSERAEAYPPAARDRVQADVEAYVSYVLATEWPYMTEHNALTPRGAELLRALRHSVTDHEPRTVREAQTYQALIDQVAVADAARYGRGEAAEPTMPAVVWFGLFTGAVVTIGMVYMLQIQRSGRELLLAGLFSALIAFLLFLIWHFDAPFTRGLTDSTAPFLTLFPDLAPRG